VSEVFRNVSEQARWLRISEKSCRRHAAAMGASYLGSRLVFPESQTLTWLAQHRLGARRGGVGKALRAI
jgi:hypothetical protein